MSSVQRVEELERMMEKLRKEVTQQKQDLNQPPPGSKRVPMDITPQLLAQRRLEFFIESLFPINTDDLAAKANRLEFEIGWLIQVKMILSEARTGAEQAYKQHVGSGLLVAQPGQMPNGGLPNSPFGR